MGSADSNDRLTLKVARVRDDGGSRGFELVEGGRHGRQLRRE
jgi:hypothetical protein